MTVDKGWEGANLDYYPAHHNGWELIKVERVATHMDTRRHYEATYRKVIRTKHEVTVEQKFTGWSEGELAAVVGQALMPIQAPK